MRRIWWRLSLLGLAGLASLLLIPLERLVTVPIGPMLLRLLSTIQPALLVLGFTAIGAWAAPKVGLDAPAVRAWSDHRPVLPILRRQFPAAAAVALAVAAILIGYGAFVRGQEWGGSLLGFEVPLVTRLLYGGLAEELLTRWGLMSMLVWVAWRLGGRHEAVPAWCYWTGATFAALLFAAGHLPLLYRLLPDPPVGLLAGVLVGNTVPGLLFGWLFWRRGLEAAMIAHVLAHLLGAIGARLL
jgi:hypothetical protein